ncbi:MAG TPA: ABC transporter ATP-binding protein [Bryobacteraceae bacterium]|jgi:ABC-2 type transport system ATP-binding protein
MTIAEISGVTKTFGKVTALAELDLAIDSGQILALLGPNGAGKTTAARLLLGLASPSRGKVRVFGRDPRDAASRVRTGAMLQVGRVPETLRVREHIALFSSYYPSPLPFSEVVLAAGLEGMENRLFGTLSGGQKQRVLFALAICGNPGLLILDEPTVGLDVESRRALWRHIRMFASRGGSVLLTTHYLEEADALADRIVVIDRGRLLAQGTPQEIKHRAATRRIRCITSLEPERVREITGVLSAQWNGSQVEIVASDSDRVVFELFTRDPRLHGLEVVGAGLEEAFLSITNRRTAEAAAQEVLQ